jgi:hypothetical protein
MYHSYDILKKSATQKTTQELLDGLLYWKASTEFWQGYKEMYAGLDVKSSDYSKNEVTVLADTAIADNALTISIFSEELESRLFQNIIDCSESSVDDIDF